MCDLRERLAHSRSKSGREDLVRDHLLAVARRASAYAEAFGAADEGYMAGLLHDLGKYGDLFQLRLQGKERGIDHWSLGSWIALERYRLYGVAAALAIQGHHVGLQQLSDEALAALYPPRLLETLPQQLRLSEVAPERLMEHFADDGLSLAQSLDSSVYEGPDARTAASMLDVRMLFSALVDADFIETEAHFQARGPQSKCCRAPGPELNPERALSAVLSHADELARRPGASPQITKLRADLLEACLAAASWPQGLFTLTAPTGSGKTLSMLAFALKHAVQHNLHRVVVVIPYLSIIEQTVGVYRAALRAAIGSQDPTSYVLEDHSLAGTRRPPRGATGEADGADEAADPSRLLAENWDAPVVVTTSVQFLESLFANRPAACRKLHRMARSVVLFDEVQTLPSDLAVLTLATLSRLSERYSTSVVFGTATQPAFTHLDEAVRRYCHTGWRPREIAPPALALFSRARRTKVDWPSGMDITVTLGEIAGRLVDCPQALCIVNLKRHALSLFAELQALEADGLYHLSTSMCPAHRHKVLDEVRRRLEAKEPCRLVSTQCVEAGVDVDFPIVYRAWGPIEAIAQAAGRCNRNGLQDLSVVHVFVPESDGRRLYPDGSYQQAADIASLLMQELGPEDMDIHSPELFDRYYRELYDLRDLANVDTDLAQAIRNMHFAEVARLYRVIRTDSINVLVPYCPEAFRGLDEQAMATGLNRDWIGRARPYTVGLFRPRQDDPIRDYLDPVLVGRARAPADDWFIYRRDDYDDDTGLTPRESMDCLIA